MVCISVFLVACGTTSQSPITVRLIDQFDEAIVEGTLPFDVPAPTEWRFDREGTLAVPAESAETFGWRAVSGIEELAVRDGLLAGSTGSSELPTLSATLPDNLKEDFLHAVEVRMRVSEGSQAGVWFEFGSEPPDRMRGVHDVFAMVSVPLEPGDEFQTYRLTNDAQTYPLGSSTAGSMARPSVRHIQVEPTDANGAEFAIESIRLITRREHLRSIVTGPGWHGLGYISRETIVSRSPERVRFEVNLGLYPWLDLAVGTVEDGPVTFTVAVETAPNDTTLLRRTVTLPGRWEPIRLDLSDFAEQQVTLWLGLDADQPGRLGFWGSPVVRHSGTLPQRAETSAARATLPDAGASVPQGVILILPDTLRRDRLDAYGHYRPTAPVLSRLASGGVQFSDAISQAPWTKPSVPSILSSLYPSTHGVVEYSDLLPSSVVTLAKVYRDAGYATFHTDANGWAGTPSRLQQGVEVLHEGSLSCCAARGFVTRFLDWLELHNDVPFFAFLHFFDPHHPYEPHPPYDTMWAAPSARAEQEARWRKLEEAGLHAPYIQIEERSSDRVPALALLEKAGVDPEAFIAHEFAWYDGSIRAMDVEIGRLLEGLDAHGLGDKTLVAVVSDHGEEFLDHGRLGHAHTAYGELLNVPLLLWWPGVVPPGLGIDETVESIDLMPTLIELSGIRAVEGIQGQSLVPLLARPEEPSSLGWVARGAFSEKTVGGRAREYASSLVLDDWKLIQNAESPNPESEYELYEHRTDPLGLRDVASEHPNVIERLASELTLRREQATASRISPDDVPLESLSSEQIRRLRSLGYIQ